MTYLKHLAQHPDEREDRVSWKHPVTSDPDSCKLVQSGNTEVLRAPLCRKEWSGVKWLTATPSILQQLSPHCRVGAGWSGAGAFPGRAWAMQNASEEAYLQYNETASESCSWSAAKTNRFLVDAASIMAERHRKGLTAEWALIDPRLVDAIQTGVVPCICLGPCGGNKTAADRLAL